MTIHHRLHLEADIAGPILDSFGMSFPVNPSASEGHILIPDITEDDPAWPRLALLLKEYHHAWVAHPRHADSVARYGSTGDSLADFAHAKWAKSRGMFMLNWVADEFLVKPEMFVQVFRHFGITSRPVLDYMSRSGLQTVVQLDIPLRADVDVANAVCHTCDSCGGRNYDRDGRNYAPMPFSAPGPLFKSNQWFGPFHSIVYMIPDLYCAIQESGFRGAYSIPCAAQPAY
jgi:hypothetical protein